jgi:hypothetical protein
VAVPQTFPVSHSDEPHGHAGTMQHLLVALEEIDPLRVKTLELGSMVAFHVKRISAYLGALRMTTRRAGSSPSLAVSSPPTSATVSCTTLRSNALIGSSASGRPDR